VPRLVNAQTLSLKLRTALKFGWRVFLRSRTIEFLRLTMLADLVRRGQIEGFDIGSMEAVTTAKPARSIEDVQGIIAELINPAFDFRTAQGIANNLHLPTDFVGAVLLELSGKQIPLSVRTSRDGNMYTLFTQRPSFFERLRPVRWFNRWWNAPSVN
jgi:hypothetical protein